MAYRDKERWNKKYQDKVIPQIPSTPIKLLQDYASLATGKDALDIACGMGRHSKYLANQGFTVDALDISSVAIATLQKLEYIHATEVDFDSYALTKEKYDLIICAYFLERKLFPQMIAALKPNGLLIFETLLHDKENESEPSNPDFLLQKGELADYFSKECELLTMKEWKDVDYKGNATMKASMVAKRVAKKV